MEASNEKKKCIGREVLEWILTIVIPICVALLIHHYLFTFARVDGSSMLDTFQSHNLVGVSRLHYRLNEPQRGEVVTVHYDESKKLYIKRLIGLPGETVEIRAGTVYINGEALEETYLTRLDTEDFGPYEVGDEEIFVLGDNRPISRDSRSVGCLPKRYLFGRVIFVLWPLNEMRGTLSIPQY